MTRTAWMCQGALYHSPIYYETDRHHVYPTYLAKLLGIPAPRETVHLCSLCHDNLHHVIHSLINEGTLGGHRLSRGMAAQVNAFWSWWQAEAA